MSKALTLDQLAARKEKAARFTRDVLADPDRADEIEDEDLEHYAARRKIEILDNPKGVHRMATKQELLDQIRELEEENSELQDQLDAVADIVAPADEDEEDDSAEGEDQGEE